MKKFFLLGNLLLLCFSASAAIYNLSASLNGANEVPANGSTGTGTLTATYDDVTNQLTYVITYSGMSSPTPSVGAHFHGPSLPAMPINAPVTIPLTVMVSPMMGTVTVPSEGEETDLLAGNWYVNLHTPEFTGGEIRGQVTAILPVELIRFDAIIKNGMVYLAWKTATELNNDYFQIAYSQDGRHFVDVGTVKGQGTSQQANNYTYVHRLPARGVNYYRLRQVDFDGSYKYSAVVTVEVEINETRIFPNPTTGILMFQSPSTEGTIRVTDSLGKLVQQQNLSQQQTIDISHQPKGVYFVALQVGNQTTVERVVKE